MWVSSCLEERVAPDRAAVWLDAVWLAGNFQDVGYRTCGGKAQLRWPEQSLVCLSAHPSSTATYLTTHPLTHLRILSLTLPQLQASVSSGVALLAQL